MRFNPKKGLVATSLALAFGSFGAAQAADTILFDPDGTAATNGAFSIGAFDWAVASVLADQANVTPTSGYNVYFHTSLQGFQDTSGGPAGAPTGLNTNFEISVIGGFSEQITGLATAGALRVSNGADGAVGGGDDVFAVTQTATFGIGGAGSFVRIFYDNTIGDGTKGDSLSGLHYDDGLKILDAVISSVTGSFGATQQFIDANDNGKFDPGETALGVRLDNFGVDNWGGQLSVSGDGSTTLLADVTYFDPNFFLTALSMITQDTHFTTENNLPFNETNPSKSFDADNTINLNDGLTEGLTVSLANLLMGLGTINGGFLGGGFNLNGNYGPDVLFQSDASTSFKQAVPEPSALALLGIGLMGLAASRRRAKG